jgi:hypothetical protein
VLAKAVREGELRGTDALRVLRHELRRRNTNKKIALWPRSAAADEVIQRYAAEGTIPPRNDSLDALHADHVHALTSAELQEHTTVEAWLHRLAQLREVVCVTAAENYRLELVERAGTTGWQKYQEVGITWADGARP